MELLNTVALAHGQRVLGRCAIDARPTHRRAIQLQLLSYDRENVSGIHSSCRNLARER